VEYFLGKKAGEGDVYGRAEQGYHATAPFVFGETLRRQAMGILGDIGVTLKYAHSEVGYIEAQQSDGRIWEQHEIELALAPLPDAADAVVLTQWVLRCLANQQGFECRLDPMLQRGHAGSGLHFHFSPRRAGMHLDCMTPEGDVQPEAAWLIAGLVRFGASLMAYGNRVPASFERLAHGKEVPRAITWGRYNRQPWCACRSCHAEDGHGVVPATVEFRLPDGSVHPHLLLAGAAQAMLAGHLDADIDAVLERSAGAAPGATTSMPTAAGGVPRSFQEVGCPIATGRCSSATASSRARRSTPP
jgi:glutamine synthetase